MTSQRIFRCLQPSQALAVLIRLEKEEERGVSSTIRWRFLLTTMVPLTWPWHLPLLLLLPSLPPTLIPLDLSWIYHERDRLG